MDTVEFIIDFDQPGDKVFDDLRRWGEETFGEASAESIFERVEDEMRELKLEVVNGWTPQAVEEAADVVLILTRAPGLWEAMERKMKINVERAWQRAGNGTGFHHVGKDHG